jgi:hypothetical protein
LRQSSSNSLSTSTGTVSSLISFIAFDTSL